jgi:hypothetical protein
LNFRSGYCDSPAARSVIYLYSKAGKRALENFLRISTQSESDDRRRSKEVFEEEEEEKLDFCVFLISPTQRVTVIGGENAHESTVFIESVE